MRSVQSVVQYLYLHVALIEFLEICQIISKDAAGLNKFKNDCRKYLRKSLLREEKRKQLEKVEAERDRPIEKSEKNNIGSMTVEVTKEVPADNQAQFVTSMCCGPDA